MKGVGKEEKKRKKKKKKRIHLEKTRWEYMKRGKGETAKRHESGYSERPHSSRLGEDGQRAAEVGAIVLILGYALAAHGDHVDRRLA